MALLRLAIAFLDFDLARIPSRMPKVYLVECFFKRCSTVLWVWLLEVKE
jgi:hypothetical protein